jgi:hypothetical protein
VQGAGATLQTHHYGVVELWLEAVSALPKQ